LRAGVGISDATDRARTYSRSSAATAHRIESRLLRGEIRGQRLWLRPHRVAGRGEPVAARSGRRAVAAQCEQYTGHRV